VNANEGIDKISIFFLLKIKEVLRILFLLIGAPHVFVKKESKNRIFVLKILVITFD